ncbi:hypothetical protein [Sulfurimonas sp. C5]|uniref:hypothetical protein n=1 Tax=Sulfurimonas sp. C5 TaxID=3036947 RepID=UPI002455C1E1|nr:hypothetical protein [Sulfurimonas sp. C5]MDH4945178.1 hypothetical protein [Sulfurimonas sp. C5]
MGALTKKEREALEDVFMSIHSKNRYDQFLVFIQDLKSKMYKNIRISALKVKKSAFTLYIKVIRK